MKAARVALFAGLLAAAPVFAQSMGPTKDVSKLEGGAFTADKAHTRIIFSYNHMGLSTSYVLLSDFSSTLTFDPKAVEKSALAVKVNLDALDTTVPKLADTLKSDRFFDVAKYPSAEFTSKRITMTGPDTGTVEGDLTLHGATKPVSLEVTFNGGGASPSGKGYVLGFNAIGHVKRSDFGVGAFAPMVGDDVTLTISSEYDRP
jgi:polyisoprenoid-binding protein YceI